MQFPIKVRLTHSGEIRRVNCLEDLPQGVSLEILGPSFHAEATVAYEAIRDNREKVITLIENWIDTAAQAQHDANYYCDMVTAIGDMFGDLARLSDDGTIRADVLAEKVPALVQTALDDRRQLKMDYSTLAQRLRSIIAVADHYNAELTWRLARIRSIASVDIPRH